MASFSKLISLLSLLVLLASCVEEEGVAPGVGDPFDGLKCNHIVEGNLTAAEFEALMQSGTSEKKPYRICLESNVEIGLNEEIDITASHIEIRGATGTTAEVGPLNINSTGSVKLVKINGFGATGMPQDAVTHSGSGKVIIDRSNFTSTGGMSTAFRMTEGSGKAVITNSELTGKRGGIQIWTTTTGAPELNISKSIITSEEEEAIRVGATSGGSPKVTVASCLITSTKGSGITVGTTTDGNVTANLTDLIITSAASGLQAQTTTGGTVTVNMTNLMIRRNGTALMMPEGEAIRQWCTTGGTVTINDNSTRPSLACNMPGAPQPISSVLEKGTTTGGTVNGTLDVANFENETNSNIPTCEYLD